MTTLQEQLAQGRVQGATAVTLGVFDGVHLGHQHLIQHLRDVAEANSLVPVVLTFSNHPLSVLRPEEPLMWLTSLEDRLELLRATGVRHVLPITFTRELSLLTAEEFLLALQEHLRMECFVVGPDFVMGHNRQGTIPVLQGLALQHGFRLEYVEPLTAQGEPVNSTAVRHALADGDMERAARYLGRPFHLCGPVERGEGRGGAQLGFPTVNLNLHPQQAFPPEGVYAAWCHAAGRRYGAAVSIGTQPTFHANGRSLVVEAFILDFEGDLYGQQVRLEFVRRLRSQERYPDAEVLVAQMRRDVEETRRVLEAAPAARGSGSP